jgi:hypothetical protein
MVALKRPQNVSCKRARTERDGEKKRENSWGKGGDRWNVFIHVTMA